MMIVSLLSDTVGGTQLVYKNGIILQDARRGHVQILLRSVVLGEKQQYLLYT